MLTVIENTKQTILPTMRSDIDGWELEGTDDWELEAIFEDMPDSETELTTQGLTNETDAERPQLDKMAREELVELYAYRFENRLDIFTGKPIAAFSSDEDSE